MTDLTGRTAVVTGGASGIGRAGALLLAEHGAKVVVADFSPLAENDEPFAKLGIESRQCDVRREAELKELMDFAATFSGRIDILVNNAGVGMVKQIDEVTEEDWDRVLDTNLKSAFFGSKHALRHMTHDGQGGSIINMASNAGILPRAQDPVYSISKLAIVGLTRSLGLCHSKDRVRFNAICPGPVGATRMMDETIAEFDDLDTAAQALIGASPLARALGRMITPEEVAQSILFLASDAAAMISGTLITIDGGKALGVPPQPA
jgi:NAD(P)-dependent dehydrogenase (short-subunit alcohol dehydrogenase family)